MSRPLVVLALALALAAPGCLLVEPPSGHMGGAASDAGPPDSGLAPVSATAACGEIAMVACEGYETCCDSHSISMNDCITALQSACDRQLGPIFRDPKAGYDPEIAAEVVAEGRALVATCDLGVVPWYHARSGLQRVLQGTVAPSQQCATSADDAAAYFSCMDFSNGCIGDASSGFYCAARRATGFACHTDLDCVEADYCEGAPGSNPIFGLPGRCQPRLAVGTACTIDAACATYLCDTRTTHQCAAVTQQTAYCGLQ